MTTWRIKDWSSTFHLAEADRSRNVWMRFPTTTASVVFRRLMRSTPGQRSYCVFIVACQLSARLRTEGLVGATTKVQLEDIADASGISLKLVSESMALLASSEYGWLQPVLDPGDNRAQNGQETGDERAKPGRETGLAHAAAESKSALPAAEYKQAGKENICSLLLGMRGNGEHLFDAKTAAAIAGHPHVTERQVAWVCEVMNKRIADAKAAGKAIENVPAYVRRMLEEIDPPAGWVASYSRRKFGASGGAA